MAGDEGHHICFGLYLAPPLKDRAGRPLEGGREDGGQPGWSMCYSWCKQTAACQKASKQPPPGGGRR